MDARHLALIALSLVACGGGTVTATTQSFATKAPGVVPQKNADGSINDQSRCEFKNKPDREASETAGPGSIQPNVRRVWAVIGAGEDRHKVLVCREIDTNFDGVKDVVRRYNDKGESLHEEADSNYDGKIDTWITFAKGRLAEVRLDGNHDGKIDEWKFYSSGKLARVKRDTNADEKPDVWEMYREGRLERMGVDLDNNQQVDRWDHDTELRRKLEDADRKKEEEAATAAAKKSADEKAAADKANNAVDDGAKDGDKKDPKKPPPKTPAAKKK